MIRLYNIPICIFSLKLLIFYVFYMCSYEWCCRIIYVLKNMPKLKVNMFATKEGMGIWIWILLQMEVEVDGRNEQWIQLTFHVCTFTSIHSYTINKTSSVYASALSLLWMTYTGMRYVMYISVNVGSPAVCLMLSIANTTYLPIVWLYKWKKLFC